MGQPTVSAAPPPTAAADFMLEVGTEELPPADVSIGAAQLVKAVEACLSAAGLSHEGVTVRRCKLKR